jgi:hypothetical protein
VQTKLVSPNPLAMRLPARWVTLAETNAVAPAGQVTSIGTCTAAPRATSVASSPTSTEVTVGDGNGPGNGGNGGNGGT